MAPSEGRGALEEKRFQLLGQSQLWALERGGMPTYGQTVLSLIYLMESEAAMMKRKDGTSAVRGERKKKDG